MESQCKTHGLTPFREVWPTACRCCAAPCRRWRRYQYSIIRHASQGCCCLAGRFFVDAARQKHVVGANSVRPWAFGQCAAMARRWMQRKVGGRTMFAPTCSTASNNYYFILPFTLLSSSPSYSLYSSYLLWLLDDEYNDCNDCNEYDEYNGNFTLGYSFLQFKLRIALFTIFAKMMSCAT